MAERHAGTQIGWHTNFVLGAFGSVWDLARSALAGAADPSAIHSRGQAVR